MYLPSWIRDNDVSRIAIATQPLPDTGFQNSTGQDCTLSRQGIPSVMHHAVGLGVMREFLDRNTC